MQFFTHLLHNRPQRSQKITAAFKYIYLDIVAFTQGRSVEAQADLIATLNDIFRCSVRDFNVEMNQCIFIPTGDGICLAIRDGDDLDYDIHLKIALQLLRYIEAHNSETADKMRQFSVRIGINENIDNLVTDINGRENVAGLGVNMAQRIMSHADRNQILVGSAVYERLRARESYMHSFKEYRALIKHAEQIPVYQYLNSNAKGLNNQTPTAFELRPEPPAELTKVAAYYLLYAAKQHDFLYSRRESYSQDSSAVVLLYMLARDAVEKSEAGKYDEPRLMTWNAGKVGFKEQYDFYDALDLWANSELAHFILSGPMGPYSKCFETGQYGLHAGLYVSKYGLEKLRQEWPDLVQEFELQLD